MPAPINYVPLEQQQPLQTMSQILGIQQQKQALQTGEYTQSSAQAKSATDQMILGERQALSNYLRAPQNKGRSSEDMSADIMSIAPNIGAEAISGIKANEKAQVGIDQNLSDLNKDYKSQLGRVIGSFTGSGASNKEIEDRLHEAVLENPKLASVAYFMRDNIDHLPDPTVVPQGADPQGYAADAIKKRDQLLSAAQYRVTGEGSENLGTAYDKKGNLIGTAQGKVTGAIQPAGQGVEVSPPPATMTAPSGEPGVAKGGSFTPMTTNAPKSPPPSNGPVTAQNDPSKPGPLAGKAAQDAWMTATKGANDHVESVRSADESYGNNKAISSAVRRLAGDAATGPGTETWNHITGILGTNQANNYQELGAFLDRQAATVRGQMGLPGTNAGAEDAKMIAGNTKYNAKVIQDKNDYTEALTDGLHQYRRGLDRVAGFSGQASPSQIAKYKSAWTEAFDPNVYIGENAYRRSKAEGDKFVASLDPKEAASLAAKRKALKDLSEGNLQ